MNLCNGINAGKAGTVFGVKPDAEDSNITATAEKGAAYILESSARGALQLVARGQGLKQIALRREAFA